MSLKKMLGTKIQEIRKRKKLTQEMLADEVGIDPKSISKIENGNNYPSAETLTSIAQALGVDVYELFVFKTQISYEEMKKEIIQSLNNNRTILHLYKMLKQIPCDKF